MHTPWGRSPASQVHAACHGRSTTEGSAPGEVLSTRPPEKLQDILEYIRTHHLLGCNDTMGRMAFHFPANGTAARDMFHGTSHIEAVANILYAPMAEPAAQRQLSLGSFCLPRLPLPMLLSPLAQPPLRSHPDVDRAARLSCPMRMALRL